MNNVEEIKDIVSRLPDKIVADDITNYLTGKTKTHLFSAIYENRTSLYPNGLIQHMSNADKIGLYEGGWGTGNYISVHFSITEKKYLYYKTGGPVNVDTLVDFQSEDWTEFYTYVRKDLLDTFIWFNTTRKEELKMW